MATNSRSVYWVILPALISMVAAILLFTAGSQPYGEIILGNKTELAQKLLNARLTCLSSSISQWGIQKDMLIKAATKPPATPGATTTPVIPDEAKELIKNITKAQNDIKNTQKELILSGKGNIDTSLLFFSKYVFVKRDVFLSALDAKGWQQTGAYQEKTVKATLIDTTKTCLNLPGGIDANLQLRLNKRASRMAFFVDYPQFGLWIVFTIAQMILWAMVVPLLIGGIKETEIKIGNNFSLETPKIVMNTIYSILITGVFLFAIFEVLIDQKIISNVYFLDRYECRIIIYGLIGYTVASFCLGIFVTLSKQLDEVNQTAVSANKMPSTDNSLNTKYEALKNLFENSFICCALILSFCVLWTGILISAVNNTEAFRFYYLLSGKNVIPNDFVYLMGLMNTLLLLIFYIPAKIKFNNLPITQDSATAAQQNSSSGIFTALSSSMGPLLITASPILASLVQSLFKLFTNH
ncbi:MAG: hypothetical protein V4577_13760 [Bacteroidota bacterium]